MKKRILLFISLLLFITNVKALTFNVDLTNIEDKTNNTSVGTITNIDVDNKELDVLFQNEGEEVSFELTITNTGDRAGTLKSITVDSSSNKVEYTNDLPENGLAINGNDFNKVLITGKVKIGATTGRGSSQIKLSYNYEEGSCPEGETLTEDETECLCPTGYERNEQGRCVQPEKEITCAEGEVYNSTKKICEKKEITPIPKTGDNILLIILLFILAGLALYAFLFKKFKSDKTRRNFGIATALITLSVSALVLVTIFGVDGLMGAVINPILKNKEIVITVNEEIDKIEVWDGNCDLDVADLTPANIFEGGVGTESNPYKIKTAEQLSCFAKSVNNGETYEGKFVKQIKNIVLNENLNEQATSGDLSNAHSWIPAGYLRSENYQIVENYSFNGTYDGDNHSISGLLLTDDSLVVNKGLFGHATGATFKNIVLSDFYGNPQYTSGALLYRGDVRIIVDNVKTYGNFVANSWSSGVISSFYGDRNNPDTLLKIENVENNINIKASGSASGIIHYATTFPASDEPTFILRNCTNNGRLEVTSDSSGGIAGNIYVTNGLLENLVNTADYNFYGSGASKLGGVVGAIGGSKVVVRNCSNTGDSINAEPYGGQIGGVIGSLDSNDALVENCYNSGDIQAGPVYVDGLPREHASDRISTAIAGIIGHGRSAKTILRDSFNTGDISGFVGDIAGVVGYLDDGNYGAASEITRCYNTGNITGHSYVGGVASGYVTAVMSYSYNTGTITKFGGSQMGGLGGHNGPTKIYYSYNAGEIINNAPSGNAENAGLCASGCREIKNSYNIGNITSKYSGQLAGISTYGTYENVYNAGDITYLGLPDMTYPNGYASILIGGIRYNGNNEVTNVYNLGNITCNLNGAKPNGSINIGGIESVSSNNMTNTVNKGNIEVNINNATNGNVYLAGIGDTGAAINSFNAGTITFNDPNGLLNGNLLKGQISSLRNTSSTGNKFNTDPNGFAIGCIGLSGWDSCTSESSLEVGTYTTESAPDILSIINGDDAFEIKQGETLPTLKAFNN